MALHLASVLNAGWYERSLLISRTAIQSGVIMSAERMLDCAGGTGAWRLAIVQGSTIQYLWKDRASPGLGSLLETRVGIYDWSSNRARLVHFVAAQHTAVPICASVALVDLNCSFSTAIEPSMRSSKIIEKMPRWEGPVPFQGERLFDQVPLLPRKLSSGAARWSYSTREL